MEQNDQNPEDSPATNISTNNELTKSEATSNTKLSFRLILVSVIAVFLIAIGVLSFRSSSDNANRSSESNGLNKSDQLDKQESKNVEQVLTRPVDGEKVPIKESQYYTVSIQDKKYYGLVKKINNEYIRMLPTAYSNGNVLTFTGNELYGPEPASYFHIPKITDLQELTDPAIINAIKAYKAGFSDAFPSNKMDDYIKNGQYQAFFFTDGRAFYAKTSGLTGAFLANAKYVYVLKSHVSSSPQVTLMLAEPDQYSSLTESDLIYWNNMKDDSQISKAASEFEQSRQ